MKAKTLKEETLLPENARNYRTLFIKQLMQKKNVLVFTAQNKRDTKTDKTISNLTFLKLSKNHLKHSLNKSIFKNYTNMVQGGLAFLVVSKEIAPKLKLILKKSVSKFLVLGIKIENKIYPMPWVTSHLVNNYNESQLKFFMNKLSYVKKPCKLCYVRLKSK